MQITNKVLTYLLIVYLIMQIIIAWPAILIYLQAWFPIPDTKHTETEQSSSSIPQYSIKSLPGVMTPILNIPQKSNITKKV